MNALIAEQLRNIARHHASGLRMARTDIKAGRVDEIMFDRLESAIEALDLLATIGKEA